MKRRMFGTGDVKGDLFVPKQVSQIRYHSGELTIS